MIKVNDRVVFRRTEYGNLELGVYLGDEGVRYDEHKYVVRLDNGEVIRFNFRTTNGKDAKDCMYNFGGWAVAKEDFVHRNASYECAAWYEDILVKAGSRFPICVTTRDDYDINSKSYIEGRVEEVYIRICGEVVEDDFGARLCGVPISNYDNKKNAGKKSTHNLTFRGTCFGDCVLYDRGVEGYDAFFVEKHLSYELADNFVVEPYSWTEDDRVFNSSKMYFVRLDNCVNKVNEFLESEGRYERVEFDTEEDELVCEVDGDWKHDHRYVHNLICKCLAKYGIEVCSRSDTIDGDGSDNFTAVHAFWRGGV